VVSFKVTICDLRQWTRKNQKEFRKIYALLDELMQDTRETDAKVMGFLRGGRDET